MWAIEDSIIRYESLKLQMRPIKNQLQHCEENRDRLASELYTAKQARDEMASKLYRSDDRAVAYLSQRNWSRLKTWLLRGALTGIGYQSLRKGEVMTGLLCTAAIGVSFTLPLGKKPPK